MISVIFSDQNIAVLFSYSAREDSETFRRLYALAELEPLGNDISVKNLKSVPYQTVLFFLNLRVRVNTKVAIIDK